MANVMLSWWYTLYMKQTEHEKKMEQELCKLGVRYRTQHPMLGIHAILDFYLPDQNLCIEIDDPSHKKKQKKDQERTERLAGLGIRVVRFTNDDVDNRLDEVVAEVKTLLKKRKKD
jgi:very-short-patch-repair endonuclease